MRILPLHEPLETFYSNIGGLVSGKMGKQAYPSWDSLVWRKKTETRTEEEMNMNAIGFGGLILQSYNSAIPHTADTNKCICAFVSPAWPLAWPIRFCSGPVCWHPSAFFGLLLFWKQFAWSRCLGMKDSRHPVTQTCWSKHLASVVSYLQSSHSNHTNARTLLCHAAFFFW